ncbi:hypothetical protein Tco_0840442 [Tanacetum coccineum]|uniref:Uncharacterized protein n=1 Tax=Tanacetum coccineum TaxID=301880 RepID=A0ABQ5ATK0_9ASTR
MNPRSCLRWKPTGRIFSNVCLRWVPTGRLFNSCTSKVESEPTHDSNVDIYHIHACKQTLGLSAADQASVFMEMMYVHISSGLVLHQMTSNHNRSELGIQVHNNEPSSSKLVPKVVPLAVKTATSRQELEYYFQPCNSNAEITEHPSDTNVFIMKMEILLEPASNKLLVGEITDALEDLIMTSMFEDAFRKKFPNICYYRFLNEVLINCTCEEDEITFNESAGYALLKEIKLPGDIVSIGPGVRSMEGSQFSKLSQHWAT